MGWQWVLLPSVGALIGWLTNFIAIRSLFRPRKPVRVLGLFTLHGVLPRRQMELAKMIGETVERDFLPIQEVLDTLDLQQYSEEIVRAIVTHVDKRLEQNVPDIVPIPVKRLLGSYVRGIVEKEAPGLVADMFVQMKDRLGTDIQIGDFVREKIEKLDVSGLEALAVRVAKKELRTIEALGGILGFLIGLIQAAILSVV